MLNLDISLKLDQRQTQPKPGLLKRLRRRLKLSTRQTTITLPMAGFEGKNLVQDDFHYGQPDLQPESDTYSARMTHAELDTTVAAVEVSADDKHHRPHELPWEWTVSSPLPAAELESIMAKPFEAELQELPADHWLELGALSYEMDSTMGKAQIHDCNVPLVSPIVPHMPHSSSRQVSLDTTSSDSVEFTSLSSLPSPDASFDMAWPSRGMSEAEIISSSTQWTAATSPRYESQDGAFPPEAIEFVSERQRTFAKPGLLHLEVATPVMDRGLTESPTEDTFLPAMMTHGLDHVGSSSPDMIMEEEPNEYLNADCIDPSLHPILDMGDSMEEFRYGAFPHAIAHRATAAGGYPNRYNTDSRVRYGQQSNEHLPNRLLPNSPCELLGSSPENPAWSHITTNHRAFTTDLSELRGTSADDTGILNPIESRPAPTDVGNPGLPQTPRCLLKKSRRNRKRKSKKGPFPAYTCEWCNRRFEDEYAKVNLTRHKRESLEGPKHRCGISGCSATFTRMPACKKHMKQFHQR